MRQVFRHMSRAGGTRTHMGVTPADFKSAASAISPPPRRIDAQHYIADKVSSQTALQVFSAVIACPLNAPYN